MKVSKVWLLFVMTGLISVPTELRSEVGDGTCCNTPSNNCSGFQPIGPGQWMNMGVNSLIHCGPNGWDEPCNLHVMIHCATLPGPVPIYGGNSPDSPIIGHIPFNVTVRKLGCDTSEHPCD
jgi:hypothetical protein